MKHVVKLVIEMQITCSEEFAERLKEDTAVECVQACFKNNNPRRVLSARVVDEELCDDSLNVFEMLDEREKASAQIDTAVVGDREMNTDDPDYISLL